MPDEVDRDFLLTVLEAREAMGSTGIGDGIAIPHVRNPILLHVKRPFVSLFLLKQPVDFDAIDGKLQRQNAFPSMLQLLQEQARETAYEPQLDFRQGSPSHRPRVFPAAQPRPADINEIVEGYSTTGLIDKIKNL